MKDNYDFSKGAKNPYADKLKDGYTVTVHYDFSKGGDSGEQTEKGQVPDNAPPCKQA